VEKGKLDPQKALLPLEKMPGGGKDTQTYRRIRRFIASKQVPNADNDKSGK
jgi:hypothetical protein